MDQRSLVIVGSGIMGRGIAAVFVRAGWQVQVIARNPQKWPELRAQTAAFAGQSESADSGRVDCHADLGEADFTRTELVIETIVENLQVKQQLFRELDALVPESIPIATNTSGFRVSEIAANCPGRERMAHAHFFMPAHLVPLVELASASFTSSQTIESLHQVFAAVNLVPVRISSDIPGLLANRMQHALMREAYSLMQQGLASADDIDAAVRYGFGFRYLAAGPLLQKEISGLDTQLSSATAIYPDLCNDSLPARMLTETVEAGHLGLKSGQGFRPWPQAAARAESERYNSALSEAVNLLLRKR